MKSFRDRVVVVTGAGSGIGRATAVAFAREGARVHTVDIRPEGLQELHRELAAAGLRLTTHLVDCSDGPAMQALAEAVWRQEGRVDILHNNVGVVCSGHAEQIPLADWEWVLQQNLWSVIHGVRAFVPLMKAAGGGLVINTASMAGLIAFPLVAPYCASKFAVVGLSESLAAELAPHGIQVIAICPGTVATSLLRAGRLALAPALRGKLAGLMERHGANPARIAQKVLAAARCGRPLQVSATGMRPLWWLKRAAPNLYQRLVQRICRRALPVRTI